MSYQTDQNSERDRLYPIIQVANSGGWARAWNGFGDPKLVENWYSVEIKPGKNGYKQFKAKNPVGDNSTGGWKSWLAPNLEMDGVFAWAQYLAGALTWYPTENATVLVVPPGNHRKLIGPGGKLIREATEHSNYMQRVHIVEAYPAAGPHVILNADANGNRYMALLSLNIEPGSCAWYTEEHGFVAYQSWWGMYGGDSDSVAILLEYEIDALLNQETPDDRRDNVGGIDVESWELVELWNTMLTAYGFTEALNVFNDGHAVFPTERHW